MTLPRERASSIQALSSALEASDAEERRQATTHLGELELKDALPLLMRALGDSDWRVRKEATIGARAFMPDRTLAAALIEALSQGENVGLRNAAVEVLASSGHATALAVADAISSLDEVGRKLAVEALGRSRDQAALGPLEAALFDQDDNVRQAAVEAIASVGAVAGEPAHKLLLRCLRDEDRFIRLAALEGLNSLGVAISWTELSPLLADPTSRTAALLAAALAEHPQAPAALVRALTSLRGGAFAQTMTALARLAEGKLAFDVAAALRVQGQDLVHRLTEIASGAHDEPDHLRAAALILAALVFAPGIANVAMAALGEHTLSSAASRALSILGVTALPALIARIPVCEPSEEMFVTQIRAAAIEIAAAIVQEQADACHTELPLLLMALRLAARDREREVATNAVYALSHLGDETDLRLMADLLLTSDPSVASAAESTLASLANRFPDSAALLCKDLMQRAVPSLAATVLLGALTSDDEAPKSTRREHLAFLSNCAASGDARTRRAAISALARIGGPFAGDALTVALSDEDRDVQLEAARALGRVCADPNALRFFDSGPPSGPPSSDRHRTSATNMLDLLERSGDSDLVAAAVHALGDEMTTWSPASMPPSSGKGAGRASMFAADDLVAALSPLAAKAPSSVAMAAVDALSRAPIGTPGAMKALLGALAHPNPAVVKAAMLKLDTNEVTSDRIARCLEHPSHEIRALAVEMLTGEGDAKIRRRLQDRLHKEQHAEVREAIERALMVLPKTHGGAESP